MTSYLVSQCLLKDNWTTTVSSSSSSATSSPRSTWASTGLSQQFRDGVAKSLKKRSSLQVPRICYKLKHVSTIGAALNCELFGSLITLNTTIAAIATIVKN